MDYLRDSATLEVQRSNVRVLEQTLKQTRDRFNVGEVTRTDVAQSEAQLAAGKTPGPDCRIKSHDDARELSPDHRQRADEPRARARRSIVSCPRRSPPQSSLGLVENPNVTASMFGIDVNYLQVKINEGALLPTIAVQAGTTQVVPADPECLPDVSTRPPSRQRPVPIYQGGAEYSLIRQSKENLAQQRLNLETTRDQTRANVVQAWGRWKPARRRCSPRRRRSRPPRSR